MKKILLLLVMLNLLPVIPAQAGISQQNQLLPDKGGKGGVIDSLLTVLKTTKEDTLKVTILNALSWELIKIGDYEPAMNHAKNAKVLAGKVNSKKGEADSYNNIGTIYYYQDNYPKALKNYLASLKIREEIRMAHPDDFRNKKGMAGSYINIGLIFYYQGNYPEALKNYFASLKITEEIGIAHPDDFRNKRGIAGSYINIGLIYSDQGNYPKAIEYYKQGVRICEQIGEKNFLANAYINIGNIHQKQGNFPEALKNFLASLKIFEELGNKRGIASSYHNIGSIYYYQDNYPEALENYLASLKIEEEIGNKAGIASSFNNIGLLYTSMKKAAEGRLCLQKSLHLSREIGSPNLIKDSYSGLAKADSALGNYKAAFEHYKMFVIYRDSLINEENTRKTVQEQMQYEFDKKEAITKAEQEKKEEVAAAENKRQKAISWSATGGAGLMLLLAGVSYRNYRNKRKAHEIIAHQKELVEEKQKEIVDSITYAKRIQYSLLAQDKLLAAHLPEHFVLFKPKDIVSGDFYWATKKELPSPGGKGPEVRCFYLACCDSTGHGVPGAFMSLLNISFLNEAVNEKNITAPHEIFNHVRQRLIENMEGGKDGMDASLIKLSGNSVEYAAAHNAPLLIRGKELIELEKDKMPVGDSPVLLPFRLHNLQLQKGDTLYLFTDGYADQFGGEKGKKFKYSKLKELLLSISHKPMSEQKEILNETFETWKGDLEQVDDVCIIGVRV